MARPFMVLKSKYKLSYQLLFFLFSTGFLTASLYLLYTSYYKNSITRFIGGEIFLWFAVIILLVWLTANTFVFDGIHLTIKSLGGLINKRYTPDDIDDHTIMRGEKGNPHFLFSIEKRLYLFELDNDEQYQLSKELQKKNESPDLERFYKLKSLYISGLYILILGCLMILTVLLYKFFFMEISNNDLYTLKCKTVDAPTLSTYEVKVSKRAYEKRNFIQIYLEGYREFVFELKECYDATHREDLLTQIRTGDSLYVTVPRPYYEHRLKQPSTSHNFIKNTLNYYQIPIVGLSYDRHKFLDTSYYISSKKNDGIFGVWTFSIIGVILSALGGSFVINANLKNKGIRVNDQDRPHSIHQRSISLKRKKKRN